MPYLAYLVRRQFQLSRFNRWRYLTSAVLPLVLATSFQALAADESLDKNEVQKLAVQGTWAAEDGWGFWTWNEDNTMCLRLFSPDDDCADTGTWTIDDMAMCYELTWWGESEGVRKNCFTVKPLGDGRYETLYHGGALASTFFFFKVQQ